MNQKQTYFIAAIVIVVILVAGYFLVKNGSNEPIVSSTNNKPASQQQAAQTANGNESAQTIAKQKESQLPPLPADNKKAIDGEIDAISKDLKTTENSASATDLSNVNLGL